MHTKTVVIVLCLLSILAGLAAWFAPISLDTSQPSALYSLTMMKVGLSLSIIYTLTHTVTVGLFLAGLHNFKAELRRPYGLLCTAVILIALAQLQAPVALLLDAIWWLTSGSVVILYVLPNILLFMSFRSFAKMLHIKSRWTQFRLVLPVSFVLVGLSLLSPVTLSNAAPTPAAAHAFLALPLWQLGMNAVCAYLAWRIKHTMGAAYSDAMRWLFFAMLTYAAMSIHFVALSYIGYDNTAYGRSGAYLGAFAILSTMFIVSGYKFWQIGTEKVAVRNASALDVVMYTASLATNTSEIDPILDDVRILTAQLDPDRGGLTADHERSLGKIYLKLEEYLISREPLRKLTKADLRQRIERQFPRSDENPFWNVITTR